MKTFDYPEVIQPSSIVLVITSTLIGTGVLTLPRDIARVTESADGWVSILAFGIIAMGFGWLFGMINREFPGQGFMSISTQIIGKIPSYAVAVIVIIVSLFVVILEIGALSMITKIYFFNRTPIEVIGLTFLLVIIYCVSGSRFALLRLNVLFFPFIIIVVLCILLLNVNFFEFQNLEPMFTTPWTGYLQGIYKSTLPFGSYYVIIIYCGLAKRTKRLPQLAAAGIGIAMIVYLSLFLASLAIFGNIATNNILFPTIELAKEVEVPGGFFERFESIFFAVWIMAIFTTAVVSYDAALYVLKSVIPKPAKMTWILILSPCLFLIAMIPKNWPQLDTFSAWISVPLNFLDIVLPVALWTIYKIRRRKRNA